VRLVRDGQFPTADTVVVNLTGRDRAPGRPHRVHRLGRAGQEWVPADSHDALTGRAWENPVHEAAAASAGAAW
jgi:hypothetical protein